MQIGSQGDRDRANHAQCEADLLHEEARKHERIVSELRVETQRLAQGAESVRAEAEPLASLTERLRVAQAAAQRATFQLDGVRDEIQKLSGDRDFAVASLAAAERRHGRWSSRLPWTRGAAQADLDHAQHRVQALQLTVSRLQASATDLTDSIRRHAGEELQLQPLVRRAEQAHLAWSRWNTAHQDSRNRLEDQERQLRKVESDLEVARTVAGSVTEPACVIAAMEAAGLPELIDQREALNERVAALDAEWALLAAELARLADEYRNTKRELLENAPVIACTLTTLTTLTTKPELASRRFDMVIIDEAASASIPQLVYAGSKADRSLAYAGDFLQNEPIVDVADAITDQQRLLKPWLGEIFGLLGIRDRASAEAHPRCVSLRWQYRYPSTIADIVNQFCYDGLLESHRRATDAEASSSPSSIPPGILAKACKDPVGHGSARSAWN